MHKNIYNLIQIEKEIQSNIVDLDVSTKLPRIIAVSKTHPMANILPLINHGHLDFGENKVQEAIDKWQETKRQSDNLNLELGNLSNHSYCGFLWHSQEGTVKLTN